MRILQRANQKYCEDLKNSQKVFVHLRTQCVFWAPNLPRLEFFCQYKVTLLSLISEYKLAKEDFRHSTTLFKTLVSCMTCNVTHVGVCGSSA